MALRSSHSCREETHLSVLMMSDYVHVFPRFDPDLFELPGRSSTSSVTDAAYRGARFAIETKGGKCECCGQTVKVYRRSIYKHMARCLIWIVRRYAENGQEWVNLKEGPVFRGGDNTKLAYWGLVIPHPTIDENLYKPTQLGVDFVVNGAIVPRYAYIYDGRVLGFSQEQRGIADCIRGGGFNKNEITAAIEAWRPR